MKKILFLTLLFTVFLSCSSDEKDDDKNNLNGTVWVYEDLCKLSFISNDECHLFMDTYNREENDYYQYKINSSDIAIYEKGGIAAIYKYRLEFQPNGNLAFINQNGLYLFELKRQ